MIYYFILHSHFYTNPIPVQLPPSIMKSMEVGWGNGYVLLPPGHPFYGKDYGSIGAYAHGGLTFSNMYKDFKAIKKYDISGFDYQLDDNLLEKVKKSGDYKFLDNYWCIGFDTAHYGDDLITCSKSYVWKETQSLYKYCLDNDIKSHRRAKIKKITDKERYERKD